MMKKTHEVTSVKFSDDNLMVVIDGKEMVFDLESISTALFEASQTERDHFEISPSGYGIHWPLIDEDLSVDGLLGIQHTPSSQRMTA